MVIVVGNKLPLNIQPYCLLALPILKEDEFLPHKKEPLTFYSKESSLKGINHNYII